MSDAASNPLPPGPPPVAAPPARSDFRFLERLRVRWAEVDAQNIVFNGHYLMYLDTASAGYWRALAMPYAETLQALGGDLFVRRATVEYAAPARYDEQLEVGLRCASIGRSSLRFVAGVFRAGRLLVGGELVYVHADPVARTSEPVPPILRAAIEAFEAGEPSVEVVCGPWAELGAVLRPLRHRVLVEEGGQPATEAHDGHDDAALHLLARNRFGAAVAGARLLPAGGGSLRLTHLVVHPLLREAQIGRAVVQAAVEAARQQGARELRARVPEPVAGFFDRLGFVAPAGQPGTGASERVRPL